MALIPMLSCICGHVAPAGSTHASSQALGQAQAASARALNRPFLDKCTVDFPLHHHKSALEQQQMGSGLAASRQHQGLLLLLVLCVVHDSSGAVTTSVNT